MGTKILHVSDIHFGANAETAHDPDVPYRDAMRAKIRESAAQSRFDCIFFTGDVAARGAHAEYEIAKRWVDDLAHDAGCGSAGVYVVPGNHDVDRTVTGNVHVVQLAQLAVANAGSEAARERQFNQAMESPETGPALFRPLENYNKFAAHYNCEIGPAERGVWTRNLPLDHGYGLKIFGLTSVLFSSCKPAGADDQRAANLYVGPAQRVFRSQEHEIVVSLIHHPSDWLLDTALHDRDLRNRSVLHFEGHVHDRLVQKTPTRMAFGAGALSPNRHEAGFEPGFNIITLDVVETAPATYALDVVAEVWAWQDNPGLFRLHQDHEGQDRWAHRIPLPKIPLGTAPMTVADRSPPPAPRDTNGAGPAIQRFWELPGSAKGRIANKFGLLTDDEQRLPERYRYSNMFGRAAQQGKLDDLVEAIRSEGDKA